MTRRRETNKKRNVWFASSFMWKILERIPWLLLLLTAKVWRRSDFHGLHPSEHRFECEDYSRLSRKVSTPSPKVSQLARLAHQLSWLEG
jgi:hypothetical protein